MEMVGTSLYIIFTLLIIYFISALMFYFVHRADIKLCLPKIKSLGENVRVTLSPFFIFGPAIKFIYKGREISFFIGTNVGLYFTTKLSYPGSKIHSHPFLGGRYQVSGKELSGGSVFSKVASKEELQHILDELVQTAEEWDRSKSVSGS